jgi:excisionase family DNA binding protein
MATATPTSVRLGELLTVSETARLLRVGEATVRRLARRGKLPAIRVGGQWRIDRDGLAASGGHNRHHEGVPT